MFFSNACKNCFVFHGKIKHLQETYKFQLEVEFKQFSW